MSDYETHSEPREPVSPAVLRAREKFTNIVVPRLDDELLTKEGISDILESYEGFLLAEGALKAPEQEEK